MSITSISIEGFRSITNKLDLDLDKGPELILLTGKNLVDPQLNGNGVGKSSIMDAVTWGLYGKTARGLKGPSVKSWGSTKGTKVAIDIHENLLTRTTSPNTLTLNGSEIHQEEVDALIGLSFDEFLHCVYFAQFSTTFLDLSPGQQLALYSQVMELSLWEQAADTATKKVKTATDELYLKEKELERALGKEEVLKLALEQAADLSKTFEAQKREKVQNISERMNKILASIKIEERKQKQITHTLVSDVQNLQAEVTKIQTLLRRAQKDLRDASSLTPVCDSCGQEVGEDYKQKLIAKYKEEGNKLAKKLSSKQEALSTALTEHDEARQQYEVMTKLLQEKKSAEGQLQQAKNDTNPHTFTITKTKENLETVSAQIVGADEQIDLKRAEVERVKFWVKTFKELRLWVIEESLLQLEIEVNSMLQALGLEGWAILFEVEVENKSGGISRGFSASIFSSTSDTPAPWESWSGGESQRLKLACNMGMANLISARKGVDLGVEFWDEPNQWLSQEGVSALLNALEQRAIDKGMTIYIADHRVFDFNRFTETIQLVKDKTGSHLQKE